jgi:hypothetical protein
MRSQLNAARESRSKMIPELHESQLGGEKQLFKTYELGAATRISFAARDPFDGK